MGAHIGRACCEQFGAKLTNVQTVVERTILATIHMLTTTMGAGKDFCLNTLGTGNLSLAVSICWLYYGCLALLMVVGLPSTIICVLLPSHAAILAR